MRLLTLPAAVVAVVLLAPAVAQVTAPPADPPPGSLLAPRMPDAPPPPTPITPEATQPAVPPAQAGTPPTASPDLGTVTAVPLPPPGATPAPAPPPPASAVGAAVPPSAPIPLTLPPFAPSPTTPKLGPAGAKSSPPSTIVAKLPTPPLSPEASPADFLRAARGALAAGRNGEARSALEMAQTRLLDRAVEAGTEHVPSDNLAVKQISLAIDALVANDRMTCLHYIEFASQTIGSPLD